VSNASSTVVQSQPDPGSCHATGSGEFSQPDPSCSPGALNPAVTQATIGQTICVSGYSKSVRPRESITNKEKLASMAAYGDSGSPSDFEYDHLVSLELGGAPNDPRNLWPEPGGSPNPKDSIENALHRLVCSGQMPLAQAQKIIATGWVAYFKRHGSGSGQPAAKLPAQAPAPSAGPDKPISEINCSDFATHAAAQQWFDRHGGSASNDVAGLDGDHDGLACESLP
jgi:Excalibur calcium-binding domain